MGSDPPPQGTPDRGAPPRATWSERLKPILLVLGAGAIVYVVVSAGPRRVLDTSLVAAPWLPGIVLLDAFYFLGESFAHRALMGIPAAKIPHRVFVGTILSSYAVSVLVPLGRAGVEVSRVRAYGPWVGGGRATAASVLVQSVSVLANALLCMASATACALALGFGHTLTVSLLVLTLGMSGFAVATVLLMRRSRVGRWVGGRIPRLRKAGEELDEAMRESPQSLARAVMWCSLSRVSQVCQAALLLVAVGGAFSLRTALVSQGVHIVGSTLGEAIPAQTGAIEASYRVFAGALGFASDPARAVALALLCRLSQIIVATVSLVFLSTVPALRRKNDVRALTAPGEGPGELQRREL